MRKIGAVLAVCSLLLAVASCVEQNDSIPRTPPRARDLTVVEVDTVRAYIDLASETITKLERSATVSLVAATSILRRPSREASMTFTKHADSIDHMVTKFRSGVPPMEAFCDSTGFATWVGEAESWVEDMNTGAQHLRTAVSNRDQLQFALASLKYAMASTDRADLLRDQIPVLLESSHFPAVRNGRWWTIAPESVRPACR
jgi:hypothetical protein